MAITQEQLKDVASTLHKWAIDNNLMSFGTPDISSSGQKLFQQTITPFSSHTDILKKKHITAIGINNKEGSIYIYTNKKLSKAEQKQLPTKTTEGVTYQYRQAQAFSIDNSPEPLKGGASGYYQTPKGIYTCGSSISIGNERSAGTLGCLVKNKSGDVFGLTNNHVIGGCSNTRTDMPIVGPGIIDVMPKSLDPFTLGHHSSVLPMVSGAPNLVNATDNTDAAIFKIKNMDLISSMQGVYFDTPSLVGDITEGSQVEKVGRTTDHTTGFVESQIYNAFPLTYDLVVWHSPSEFTKFNSTVYFYNVYKVVGDNGAFSSAGDSGSLVVMKNDKGERVAVGLVFAGRAPNTSYILPLKPILKALDMTLVAGHNTKT